MITRITHEEARKALARIGGLPGYAVLHAYIAQQQASESASSDTALAPVGELRKLASAWRASASMFQRQVPATDSFAAEFRARAETLFTASDELESALAVASSDTVSALERLNHLANQEHGLNIDGALEKALTEPNLAAALGWLAVWENERTVRQAIRNTIDNKRNADGKRWDTCFEFAFAQLLEKWPSDTVTRAEHEAALDRHILHNAELFTALQETQSQLTAQQAEHERVVGANHALSRELQESRRDLAHGFKDWRELRTERDALKQRVEALAAVVVDAADCITDGDAEGCIRVLRLATQATPASPSPAVGEGPKYIGNKPPWLKLGVYVRKLGSTDGPWKVTDYDTLHEWAEVTGGARIEWSELEYYPMTEVVYPSPAPQVAQAAVISSRFGYIQDPSPPPATGVTVDASAHNPSADGGAVDYSHAVIWAERMLDAEPAQPAPGGTERVCSLCSGPIERDRLDAETCTVCLCVDPTPAEPQGRPEQAGDRPGTTAYIRELVSHTPNRNLDAAESRRAIGLLTSATLELCNILDQRESQTRADIRAELPVRGSR